MKRFAFLIALLLLAGCTTKPMPVDRFNWNYEEEAAGVQRGAYPEKIIEGRGVNGIVFGDPRSKVLALWGPPDREETRFSEVRGENIKELHYTDMGIIVNVSASKDTVCCSFVLNHRYRGKTTRGIGYGDELGKVIDLYGMPDEEEALDWRYYAKLGIKFYVTGGLGNQYVSLIEVLPPVTPSKF